MEEQKKKGVVAETMIGTSRPPKLGDIEDRDLLGHMMWVQGVRVVGEQECCKAKALAASCCPPAIPTPLQNSL
jgi:hypothetical protein